MRTEINESAFRGLYQAIEWYLTQVTSRSVRIECQTKEGGSVVFSINWASRNIDTNSARKFADNLLMACEFCDTLSSRNFIVTRTICPDDYERVYSYVLYKLIIEGTSLEEALKTLNF